MIPAFKKEFNIVEKKSVSSSSVVLFPFPAPPPIIFISEDVILN